MNIWFTSDTHYGHTNISGPKISNWSSGYRDFNSVHEMNMALVDGINKYVKEDDMANGYNTKTYPADCYRRRLEETNSNTIVTTIQSQQ